MVAPASDCQAGHAERATSSTHTADSLTAQQSRAVPLLARSTSASSIRSTLSFLSDASTATIAPPAASHSVWSSSTSPYPRMLLLLLVLSATFTLGFCLSSRLSCAMGHFVIGKLRPGAEPRALAVLASCVTVLVPANFIAAFIFHFAKAQPGVEGSECDLTRPSGWMQLGKQLVSVAVGFISSCCVRRRDTADHPAAASINNSSDTSPSQPSLSALSITRSFLLSLLALLSFLFTAHTPVGLWLRNGFLDVLSTLLTLFPSYLHNAFGVQGFYSVSMQRFMQWLLGEQWVTLVTWGLMILNTTRTVVLLPLWYRDVPWRQQLSIDGTPLPQLTLDAHCDLCAHEQVEHSAERDEQHCCDAEDDTTIKGASLNCPPTYLSRASPPLLRISSIADTLSPNPSPRSALSDEVDRDSDTSDDWQLDAISPPRSLDSVDVSWIPPSLSISSSTSTHEAVNIPMTGGRSVMWLFLVLAGVVWFGLLILSMDVFRVLELATPYVVDTSAWTNSHPTLVLCVCFGTLLLFLVVDHVRHNRHSQHQQQAFTPDGCGCRTPYLLLLCVLISLDSIYYWLITPTSSLISQSYLAIGSSLHGRAFTVLTFYALMLMWQLMVRYVAMHALPRGSSLAVLFPVMLIEDVWADLIFTSFAPFSLSFFVIAGLHLVKTFVRDFDLLPSVLLYLPTLLASPSTASVRACLTQSSAWRLAFPRRVLRHQNLVTELCAKVVVVAVLCGDMVGENSLGPPLMLIDPSLPFNGVYWDQQRRQRAMIVAALSFLAVQQCAVHAVVLRLLSWVEGMDQADKHTAENQTAALYDTEALSVEDTHESTDDAVAEATYDGSEIDADYPPLTHPTDSDDSCHIVCQAADDRQPWPATGSVLPRSASSSSATASTPSTVYTTDGIVWLDRHWQFHFLFFVCCIVRLVSVVLSMVSDNLHKVYFDNRLMCTYVRWMSQLGYQGSV